MTITIPHPTRHRPHSRRVPLAVLLGLALTIVVALAVTATVISRTGETTTGTDPAVHLGPNADLAPDVVNHRVLAPTVPHPGPNADLAPDVISQQAAAVASNAGPNADLARSWADVLPSAAPWLNPGPNADLAPAADTP